jgi:minimal PKS acyl carrier protein
MTEQSSAPGPAPTYEDLAEVIKKSTGVTVTAETLASPATVSFAQLGVDSLGVLGVVAALENRHGVRLGPEAVTCESPEQLRQLMAAAIAEEDSDARAH